MVKLGSLIFYFNKTLTKIHSKKSKNNCKFAISKIKNRRQKK